MPILSIVTDQSGVVGYKPKFVYINTTDTIDQVTVTGYLNNSVYKSKIQLEDSDLALVTTKLSQGDTNVQVGFFEIQKSGRDWSLVSPQGNITLPTTAAHVAVFSNTKGHLTQDPAVAIIAHDLQVDGNVTVNTDLQVDGNITVNTDLQVDGNITVNTDLQVDGNITVNTDLQVDGNVTVNTDLQVDGNVSTNGSIDVEGDIVLKDAANANLKLQSSQNVGNAITILKNSVQAQSSTYYISDVGDTIGSLLVSEFANADPNANIIDFRKSVSAENLANGPVILYQGPRNGSQYRLREIMMSPLVDFSGGGGDRDLIITDGNSTYTTIPNTSLQALTIQRWGAPIHLPWPLAGVTPDTLTVADAPLVADYSGGTANYIDGTVIISGTLVRVT